MANERREDTQDPTPKDQENVEVTELEDDDLEDASGGTIQPTLPGGDFNCGC